jgi:predicted DNA-binding transcriptional regulator AlpA
MHTTDTHPAEELITLRALMAQLQIGSRSTAYRRIKAKTLPAPLDFGNGQIRFRASDVAQFIDALPSKTYAPAFARPSKSRRPANRFH